MLAPYIERTYPWFGPWVGANFNTIVVVYLAIGFIGGLIMLKFERSEEPVGTLMMTTFFWGLILPFIPFVLIWLLIGGLLKLLGIEAAETTNDRY